MIFPANFEGFAGWMGGEEGERSSRDPSHPNPPRNSGDWADSPLHAGPASIPSRRVGLAIGLSLGYGGILDATLHGTAVDRDDGMGRRPPSCPERGLSH